MKVDENWLLYQFEEDLATFDLAGHKCLRFIDFTDLF